MYSIFLLLSFIAILVFIDHTRFWRQTDNFFEKAQDLCDAYNTVLEFMKNPKNDGDEIPYERTNFVIVVKYGDYEDFVKKIQVLVWETEKSYEAIDERYMYLMSKEQRDDILETYEKVERIEHAVRLSLWQNEWK